MSSEQDITLWPGLPEPKLPFELVIAIPADDAGFSLPPAPHGAEVSAESVLRVPLKAAHLQEAAVLGFAAAGAWARVPGARAEVRPAQ